jgi:hypothetical protein
MTKSAFAAVCAAEFASPEIASACKFQAKVAFISELPNHPIVEMLCPLARCNVLVNDYYVKFRPVDQVERSVGISNWRKLHGIMDTFALANQFFGFSNPPHGVPTFPVRRTALHKDKSRNGQITYKVFANSKRLGTTRLFEPSGGKFWEDVSRQDSEL